MSKQRNQRLCVELGPPRAWQREPTSISSDMKCPQGGQPGASPGRDGGVRRPATGVAGKEGSVGMEGASRATWTRRGLRLPGPWVSHVRFSQAAIPDRLRHSWEAEWAGGGAQTQDQVASLRARVLPLTGWLCVPGQATLLGASASSICKTGVTNAEPIDPTGQRQARACHRQVRDALCLSLPSFSRAALSQFLRRGCGLGRSALYIHEFWVRS